MRSPPRILFFDPYLSTLGGGERYLLTFAEIADAAGASVTVASPTLPPPQRLRDFDLPHGFEMRALDLDRFSDASRSYDCVVYLTNSIPQPSFAPRSYLVVQFPFRGIRSTIRPFPRRWARDRLSAYECIVYSEYCRHWLLRRWHRDAMVLPPPIRLGTYEPGRKRNIILSVGRFFAVQHSKRQDILVEAFGRLPASVRSTWRLALVGGVGDDASSKAYVSRVRSAAADIGGIDVRTDVSQETLESLYAEASLFWHATGYGRPRYAPGRAEHFGMTTAEAMSFGAVPLVYGDGAQPEIVGTSGYTWQTIDELVSQSSRLASDEALRARLAAESSRAVDRYDESRFREGVERLLFGENQTGIA